MVSGRDVPAVKVNLVRLLQELNRAELDFDRVERLIKQEVALSVKLLRYLQSASFGWRHEVSSIGHAIRLLGEQATRKWASLVVVTLVGEDKPMELVTTSLVRAQFCEEIGVQSGLSAWASDLFLTGLFSTLDALLDRPLAQVLEQMSVAPEIRAALLSGEGRLGDVLATAVAYDRGDWERITALAGRLGVAEARLPEAYKRAMEWVGKIFAA
jgi:EAL and modified HD-GYP domain-containing signal transduction protein